MREVLDHEGRGGGFSEVERERITEGGYVHDERIRDGWRHEQTSSVEDDA